MPMYEPKAIRVPIETSSTPTTFIPIRYMAIRPAAQQMSMHGPKRSAQ